MAKTKRKIKTFYQRRESLPEILTDLKKVLQGIPPEKEIFFIEMFNTTAYPELVVVFEG